MIKLVHDDIALIHDYWLDVKNRNMWIHGIETIVHSDYAGTEPGVEYMMSTRVIKNLHILRQISPSKEITIHLHTCGGMWEEGMAIYDAIQSMPYRVTMINHTHARSMSSIILQSADYRYMMPHSYFMFHRGSIAIDDSMEKVYSAITQSKLNDQVMIDIYADKMGESRKFGHKPRSYILKNLNKMMNEKSDVYLSAQESIEWGFADEILTRWI